MSAPAVRSSRGAVAASDAALPGRSHPRDRRADRRAQFEAVAVAQQRRQRRSVLVGTLIGCIFAASLFAVVSMHVHMAQNQFGLQRVEIDTAEQQRVNERLRNEVARLTAPDRIVQEARRLGLVPPETVTPISVEDK